ncbi:phage/plasmid primase%2C P4 family%2C C-terminal domain [uncultured Clostridium sp.]|nr:phage/plasmid primase%2C P4 family%2C C-terminal domain [uncultured Clostridium sp.]
MGLDLSSIKTSEGIAVLPETVINQYRQLNAEVNGDMYVGDDGKVYIPTQECLQERYANPNLTQAITVFEAQEVKPEVPDSFVGADCMTNVSKEAKHPIKAEDVVAMTPVVGVYMPEVEDVSKYKKLENQSSSKDFPSAEAAEKILAFYRLLRHGGELYLFNEQKGVYQKLTPSELLVLIDEAVGGDIRKANRAKAYDEIKKFLQCDYRLKVGSQNFLPTQFWAFRESLVDTVTWNIFPNDGCYFVRSTLSCPYILDATCPVFDRFLESITGGDEKEIELIIEIIGYILSPDVNAKNFFVLVGPKDTGKSVLARVISRFFAGDAVSLLSANDFGGKFDVAELEGKRLNLCMDLPDTPLSAAAVGKIKAITGDDYIRSDVKFKTSVRFRNTAKLLFGANYLVRTEKPDTAFSDRLITIPFRYPIPKDKQDKMLEERLATELPGIAIKALKGYCRLRANNYVFPELEVPADLGVIIDWSKVLFDFVRDYCIFNQELQISTDALYQLFCEFCTKKKLGTIEKNEFSAKINKTFKGKIEKKKIRYNGDSVWGYVGIGVK